MMNLGKYASRKRWRFGVFEVDLGREELRKRGLRIKLQGQPLRLLMILLERPGEVVTREDLQSRLWDSAVFVDFDHSLNKAVNKLRDALGDSADSPRFIETLARRGYRFVAPVQEIPEAESAAAIAPPNASPETASNNGHSFGLSSFLLRLRGWGGTRKKYVLAVLASLLLAATMIPYCLPGPRRQPQLRDCRLTLRECW